MVLLAETHIVDIEACDQYSNLGLNIAAYLSHSRHIDDVAIYVKLQIKLCFNEEGFLWCFLSHSQL